MDEVRQHLVILERQGLILKWHDRKIPPGSEWKLEIDARLMKAAIFLLFISSRFMDSDYCYEQEMKEALRRHDAGEAHVIPVILSPCLWQTSPLGRLQVLPRDGRPVTSWENRDEACLDVAQGVLQVVRRLRHDSADSPSGKTFSRSSGAPSTKTLIYCSRCGCVAGTQSVCTGAYTHHDFRTGVHATYCRRCGLKVGTQGVCTGAYTHHEFVNMADASYCRRCGARAGIQSICTGAYTHHDFISG